MAEISKEYSEMLDRYLAEDSSAVFRNFSPAHAREIITKFLERAEYSVEILSGSFCDEFYNALAMRYLLRQAALKISRNRGRIRIVTTSRGGNAALRGMIAEINGELRSPVIQYIPAVYHGDTPLNHFMVVDAKRYRLEEPHDDTGKMPECVKAEVCCNGREKSAELLEFFNMVWERLTPKPEPKAGAVLA